MAATYGGEIDLLDVDVRDVAPTPAAQFGDGLQVVSGLSSVHARALSVHRSARAAVGVFGGSVELTNSVSRCNPIDLDGESLAGQDYVFTDSGGNTCGCADEQWPCQIVSAGLVAPEPPQRP